MRPKRCCAISVTSWTASAGESVTVSRLRSPGLIVPSASGRVRRNSNEGLPEVAHHEHDRKSLDLAGLHEGHRLEDLVERAEPAGQHDERVRVLDEHDLADKEVAEGDPAVEILIRSLLRRQLDVAADRVASGFFGPAVRGFHDARAAAVITARARQLAPDLTRQPVVPVIFLEAGRAEDRHAGSNEMERAEAPHELDHDTEDSEELLAAGLRPLKKAPDLGSGTMAPVVLGVRS